MKIIKRLNLPIAAALAMGYQGGLMMKEASFGEMLLGGSVIFFAAVVLSFLLSFLSEDNDGTEQEQES